MKFHAEGFTRTQLEAAARVGELVTRLGGHLAGGSAVALHLGHRRSVDLDFFFGALPDPEAVAEELGQLGTEVRIREIARGTLHASYGDVPISFLEYRHPLLEPPIPWSEGRCRVASVRDLATLKLNAVAGRGHRKDFYDVFAIGSGPCPLANMLAAYRARFPGSAIGPVLLGLTYFTDADRQRDPVLLQAMPWNHVKATIQGWVKDYVARFPG